MILSFTISELLHNKRLESKNYTGTKSHDTSYFSDIKLVQERWPMTMLTLVKRGWIQDETCRKNQNQLMLSLFGQIWSKFDF